ncbi:MAG: phosphatidylserine decarboxylase [Segniliparus sp.]|uniref:phosphatidylserine decarboxylase n=1 Tax=Segniliparus sp. TaxID=2804064 RepID=UPI003F393591
MALPPHPAGASGPKAEAERFLDLVKTTLPQPHPAGYPFIVGGLGAAGLGLLLPGRLGRALRAGGLSAATACAVFFRNPARVAPDDQAVVVSPADGRVSLVDTAAPPAELGLGDEPLPRVSIFLSVFDVHVQHAPVSGKVLASEYRPGTFTSAERPEASERNERQSIVVQESATGKALVVTQIAGLLARRIVCEAAAGSDLRRGEVYGLIRFGSRVDVYLPAGTKQLVKAGQRAVAGETALATLAAPAPARRRSSR